MARSRAKRSRLRTRILTGVICTTIVTFGVFDLVTVTMLRHYLVTGVDSRLQLALNDGSKRLGRSARDGGYRAATRLLERAPGSSGDYVEFLPSRGPIVAVGASAGAPDLPQDISTLALSGQAQTVRALDGRRALRLATRRVDGGILVIATSLAEVQRTSAKLMRILLVTSGIAILTIALIVTVIVSRGFRGLRAMAREADRISAGDISRRIGAEDPDSELGRLATALNDALAWIRQAMQERQADHELMRRFFADASHELRTPIAALRANAELYEQGALTERSQVDETVHRIRLEAERMGRLVEDMLDLARFDRRPKHEPEHVELSDLLEACVQRARITDPERTWESEIAGGLVTQAAPDLITRAVDNLIANVRTHTEIGATATLTAAHAGNWIKIEVADDGPGVPGYSLPLLFDRFYRANAGSARAGSGLGLAIVADVVAAHDGYVAATLNDPHGLCITLSLPAGERGGEGLA